MTMLPSKTFARQMPGFFTGILLAVMSSGVTHAGLVVDLRLPEGGKTMDVSSVPAGTRVPIDVYAVVTGTGDGVEGYKSMHGSFISSLSPGTAGAAGAILPAGDLDEATFTMTLAAITPYNGNGATPGQSKEIGEPDGILDLGDEVNRSDLGELVVFRANSMQVTSGTIIPNGREFRLGRIELLLEDVPDSGEIAINWGFRRTPDGGPAESAALWRQDGAVWNGTGDIGSGAPVVFVVPEPTSFALVALGLLYRSRSAGKSKTPHSRAQ